MTDRAQADTAAPRIDQPQLSVAEQRARGVTKRGVQVEYLSTKDLRAARNRAYDAQRIRERINAGNLLKALRNIDRELVAINASIQRGSLVFSHDGTPVLDPATGLQMSVPNNISEGEARALALRLQTLRQRTDIHFRKLAKLLPDLRAVDLSAEGGNGNPLAPFFAAIADAARVAAPTPTAPGDDNGNT